MRTPESLLRGVSANSGFRVSPALTYNIAFLLSEFLRVWNHQFEVEVTNHAEPRCWWRNKVQTVLGLNLLCATDYFGYGKGAKMPHKSCCPLRAWGVGSLQPLLLSPQTSFSRDAHLNLQKPLSYCKLSILLDFELLEVNANENQAFNGVSPPCAC